MKREDDFAVRREHLKDLTDEQLYDRFWELIKQVDEPLLELGYKNTTPSVERAVLLRMGVSSLDCQPIVNHCMDHGLMGKGAVHDWVCLFNGKGYSQGSAVGGCMVS